MIELRVLFRWAGGVAFEGDERVLATRGQTDMRGLVTAGRAFRLERDRLSRVERRLSGLLIAVSRVAPRGAVIVVRGRRRPVGSAVSRA